MPGLARVAAVAPPVDLVRCSRLIAQPRNRFYEKHFVRGLTALVRQRLLEHYATAFGCERTSLFFGHPLLGKPAETPTVPAGS